MFKKDKIEETTEIVAKGLIGEGPKDKKHARSVNINWPTIDFINKDLEISKLQKDASEISAVIGSSIRNTIKAKENILKGDIHGLGTARKAKKTWRK